MKMRRGLQSGCLGHGIKKRNASSELVDLSIFLQKDCDCHMYIHHQLVCFKKRKKKFQINKVMQCQFWSDDCLVGSRINAIYGRKFMLSTLTDAAKKYSLEWRSEVAKCDWRAL